MRYERNGMRRALPLAGWILAGGLHLAVRAADWKVSELAVPPDAIGPGWTGPTGLVIDDLDAPPGTSPEAADMIALLQQQMKPLGIVATADFTYRKMDGPMRQVTLRVFQFASENQCAQWMQTKYQFPGWEKKYRPVQVGDRPGYDSRETSKRIVSCGRFWITAGSLADNGDHLRALDRLLERLGAARAPVPRGEDPRPNLLVMMADDFGAECVSAYGGEIATPHLDRLAAEGVRFRECFANPLCTPSRVKIMTGQYNVRNYVRFGVLDRGQVTFAHRLRDAGYATCVTGKWQLGSEPDAARHFGFDESCLWQHTRDGRRPAEGPQPRIDARYVNPYLEVGGQPVDSPPGSYGPDVCADYALDFIARHQDRPWLVYMPMILTHCPFDPTPDSADWDPARPGSTTYKGDRNRPQEHFRDMTAYADKIVGRMTARLEALGLRENTLILFTGDNGTDRPIQVRVGNRIIPGGKGRLDDFGTRVPLIASWPARIAEPRVVDDLVDFADVLPTLCEAAAVALPADPPLDGVSFLDVLEGRSGRDKPWVYIWYRGEVLVRTRSHILRSRHGEDTANLFRSPEPWTWHSIPAPERTPEDQDAYATLWSVKQRLEATRPVGWGIPQK